MNSSSDPFEGRRWAVPALMVLTVISWLSVILLPLLITAYIEAYGLSAPVAGALSTAEIGALSVAALLVSPRIHRMDKRSLCLIGCVAVVVGNVLSCTVSSLWPLVASRIIVGVGQGVIVAAINALPAQSQNSQRLYALSQVGLGLGAGVLIFAAPLALARSAALGVFWVEIFAGVVAFVCAVALPSGIDRGAHTVSTGRFPVSWPIIGAFLSTMLFFIAQTAAWAFADRVGTDRGLTSEALNSYLGVSVLIGVVGSSTATWLGNRLGILLPLIVGFVAVAGLCVAMYSIPSEAAFIAGVLLINVFIVFVSPYIFTVLAELDSHGRVASAGGAFTNFGNTIAPTLSGLTAAYVGYSAIGYAAALCLIAGLMCALPAANVVTRHRTRMTLETPVHPL